MKKFEKKTEFNGPNPISIIKQQWGHITDAHAEIDRKERVITSLQKQLKEAHGDIGLVGSGYETMLREKDAEIAALKQRETDFYFLIQCALAAVICVPDENYNSQQWALGDIKKVVDELTALRAQVPGEWINVKGNEEIVIEAGTYEYQAVFNNETFLGAVRFKDSLPLKAYANATFWTKLRLITRLADFNPQLAPLEVQVGFYSIPGAGRPPRKLQVVAECATDCGKLWLCVMLDALHFPFSRTTEELTKYLTEKKATYIGGDADA